MPGVTDKERDYLDIYMMMVGSGGPGGLSCIKVGLPALVMCSTDNTAVAVQVMLHISYWTVGWVVSYNKRLTLRSHEAETLEKGLFSDSLN